MTDQERQAILAAVADTGGAASTGVVVLEGGGVELLRRPGPGIGTYLVLCRPDAASAGWPLAAWQQHVQLGLVRGGIPSAVVTPKGSAAGYLWFTAAPSRLADVRDGTSNTLGIADGTSNTIMTRAMGGDPAVQMMQASWQMQEMNQSFNMQYLMLQQKMQSENRQYTMLSNIMKTKHDTAKNALNNIR